MLTDAELLIRYSRDRDGRAFAELVERQLGLVYAAALRRTGGRPHLAEEVSQKVFTDLARKASSLCHHPVLTAWLHRSTRYAAVDIIRAEQRRQKLKETLAAMPEDRPDETEAVEWERLRPVLDEAMDQLRTSDREAMFLRYFEGLGFAELGKRLNLSENAARMRTERALGKLRQQLGKRGVTSTTTALALLLVNRAVAAAPEGLAGGVAATALAKVVRVAGTGTLLHPLTGGKLVAWATVALCTAGLGVLGWHWVETGLRRPATREPELVLAADAFAANALAVYRIMAEVHPAGIEGSTESGSVSVAVPGQAEPASPREAMLDFAEAARARDVPRLAQLLAFDAEGTVVARSIHARMPAEMREELRTPEELFAFFYAADTLLSPVPPTTFLQTFIATEIKPGRMAVHQPGTAPRGLEFVLTIEGWKLEVPTPYLQVLSARILTSETLAKLQALPLVREGSSGARETIPAGSARAALASFAAACNRGDIPAASALLQFDPPARQKALAFLAALPPALRGKWHSPEELAADLLVSGAIHNPYPTEAVLASAAEEKVGDRRVALLLPGATRESLEFQQTDSAWKRVITEAMVDDYLQRMSRRALDRP